MKISDVHSGLTSSLVEWKGFLANPQYIRQSTTFKDCVTWKNRQNQHLSVSITPEDVAALVDSHQYSLQILQDGSIFRIYYEFDRARPKLTAASLAFLLSGDYYDVSYFGGVDDVRDGRELRAETGWLRIDYSARAEDDGGVIHPCCHMHLSQFPAARITLDRVPNPCQFIEFVIALCYPDVYKSKRLDPHGRFSNLAHMSTVNSPASPSLLLNHVCDHIIHVKVPG